MQGGSNIIRCLSKSSWEYNQWEYQINQGEFTRLIPPPPQRNQQAETRNETRNDKTLRSPIK